MPSSPSEARWRWGAAALFLLLMAASAATIHGITPLTGAKPTPASVSQPADRTIALLSKAARPFDQATLCEPLKAYLPDRVELGLGSAHVDTAPRKPVILCTLDALDIGAATGRARQDGLRWVRRVAGTDLVAFAADQPGFERAMAQAGIAVPPDRLRPVSPLLHGLRSDQGERSADGWRFPPKHRETLLVYGPYVGLPQGAYRVRLHLHIDQPADRCGAVAGRLGASIAVTGDAGVAQLSQKAPADVTPDAGSACGLTLSRAFQVQAAQAAMVETLLFAANAAPVTLDGYSLEADAPPAAQSR